MHDDAHDQTGGRPNEKRSFQGTWTPAFWFEWVEAGTATPIEAWLWQEIQSFQRAGRECYISNAELGRRVGGLKERQIQYYVSHLIELGVLERVLTTGPNGESLRYLTAKFRPEDPPCNKMHPPQNNAPPPCNKMHQKDTKRNKLSRPGGDGTVSDFKFRRMAERLCNAIRQVHRVNCTSKLHSWAKTFRLLHTVDGVDVTRIKTVLKWYCGEIPTRLRTDKYFITAESATAFREKFVKIEAAMRRDARDRGEEMDPAVEPDDGPRGIVVDGTATLEEWDGGDDMEYTG